MSLFSCGVPQGSIGGPLLWLCFTCDQPDVIHEHPVNGQDLQRGCSGGVHEQEGEGVHHDGAGHGGDEQAGGALVGYVDDGAYSYAHTDPVILSEVLSRKYALLEDWMNSNKLVVTPNKTHIMVRGTRKSAG